MAKILTQEWFDKVDELTNHYNMKNKKNHVNCGDFF